MPMYEDAMIGKFFTELTQCSYDKAIDLMEKQGRVILRNTWPDTLIDILCDFALAEKNYSDANFEPIKSKMVDRKEDKNYLGFVYRALNQDLERLLPNVVNVYISKIIPSLLHFISIRLKILELYDKLYEVGSSNNFIDFNELAEAAEKINCKYSDPTPVDGLLKITQYTIDCLKHLFKCHNNLENWSLMDAVLNLKKGHVAFSKWEKVYRSKETWIRGTVLNPIPLPPIMFWFNKFRHMTLSKCTLYFYDTFCETNPVEVTDQCKEHKLLMYSKIQLLQKKSDAQYIFLVYDASHIHNYTGPNYVSSYRVVKGPFSKYPTMLWFPMLDQKEDAFEIQKLEWYISRLMNIKKKKSVLSLNEIDLTSFERGNTFLSMQVDLKIFFLMYYPCKLKNEERDKAMALEFVSQLRCHKLFTTINHTRVTT